MDEEREFRTELDALYAKERRAKRRRLFWVQALAAAFAVVAIVMVFTVDYRAIRVAGIPFVLAVGILRFLDREWLSLHQRFSIGLIGVVMGAVLLRFVLAMVG